MAAEYSGINGADSLPPDLDVTFARQLAPSFSVIFVNTLGSYIKFAYFIRRSNGVAICFNSINIESLKAYCNAQSFCLPPAVFPITAASIDYPRKFSCDQISLAILVLMLLLVNPYLYLPHFSALPFCFRFLPYLVGFFRIRLIVLDDGLNSFRSQPHRISCYKAKCTVLYPDCLANPPSWGSIFYPNGDFLKYQKTFPVNKHRQKLPHFSVQSKKPLSFISQYASESLTFIIDSPGIQDYLNSLNCLSNKTFFIVHPNPGKRANISRLIQNYLFMPLSSLSYSLEEIFIDINCLDIFVGETIVAFNLLELKRRGLINANIHLVFDNQCLLNYAYSLVVYSDLYTLA